MKPASNHGSAVHCQRRYYPRGHRRKEILGQGYDREIGVILAGRHQRDAEVVAHIAIAREVLPQYGIAPANDVVDAVAGITCFIDIDGFANSNGQVRLNLTSTIPPPIQFSV